nr:hypothetical protein [Burkholderia vietnamiensis]
MTASAAVLAILAALWLGAMIPVPGTIGMRKDGPEKAQKPCCIRIWWVFAVRGCPEKSGKVCTFCWYDCWHRVTRRSTLPRDTNRTLRHASI